jgi:hypothetical protein
LIEGLRRPDREQGIGPGAGEPAPEAAAGPTHGPGRHRQAARWAVPGLVALAVALVAGGMLVGLPPAKRPPAPGPLTLATAWPKATVGAVPASAPDGPAYDPLYLLDAKTSVGTAASPDGTRMRLLLRAGNAAPRVLRSLPIKSDPLFGGVTAAGDDLAWAESTAGAGGQAVTRLWTVNWRSGAAPRTLTADTGAVAFFSSQYDLVIANGRLNWVAVAPTRDPITEVRSVSLTGGPVSVRKEPGPWALSAWPWLVSAITAPSADVQLRNLETRKRITVPTEAAELITCSPAWCRAQVLAGNGPTRLDLMRPSGSERRQIAGAAETVPIVDVAVLDRFELLTRAGTVGSPTSSQELLLYDIPRKRTVIVANGVGMVVSRAGMLWWSTGDAERLAWHVLDLRTLG